MPLAVEIGCGVGLHPIQFAKNNPQSQILAIERTQEKYNKFNQRLKNHPDINNVFPAHADAAWLLPHLELKGHVDQFFILYPNPYPKNKHKNLRFAHSALMSFVVDCLKPGGTLTMASNIKDYIDEVLNSSFVLQKKLELLSSLELSKNHPPRSHFEKKYLARGETCYDLVFRRV